MDPFEFALALAICVILPISIIKTIVSYKRDKAVREDGGESLGTSELEAIIRMAVEESVRPLQRQVAALERRLEAGALTAPALELDEAEDDDREALPGRTLGRRASA